MQLQGRVGGLQAKASGTGNVYWFNDRGGSTCVLCIHGRPGNSLLMNPFEAWCEQRSYDCYRYDQFSCRDKSSFQGSSEQLLALLVDELQQHVSSLHDRNLLIIAHSFGAVLLCEALQRYQWQQQRMKIVLSGFCPEREAFLAVNQRRLDDFAHVSNNAQAEVRFFESHICRRDALTQAQFDALQVKPLGDISLRSSYLELLQVIRCPVLITYGEEDICTDYQVQKTREYLLNSQCTKFSGAAHYPFIEQSQHYFQTLDLFMTDE